MSLSLNDTETVEKARRTAPVGSMPVLQKRIHCDDG